MQISLTGELGFGRGLRPVGQLIGIDLAGQHGVAIGTDRSSERLRRSTARLSRVFSDESLAFT
jgi:hypothetical protein